MGKLRINSLKYKGKKYYYQNNQFGNGLNLLVGDNGNGKSTFTYLIVYCLGINVEFFKEGHREPIVQILNDTNKSVELDIIINEENYILRREIGENIINVYDIKAEKYTSYSVHRLGLVYQKENMTFSDWIMKKLNIEYIEIEQNDSVHRLNFDDLFRYIYYDQLTENKKIISDFGVQSSDYFKNSNIMKRSIFEVLMSGYSDKYYEKFFELKALNKKLNIEKQKLKSIEIIQSEILKQLSKSDITDINAELNETKVELKRLIGIREDVKRERYFGEEVVSRIQDIQNSIVVETHKLKNYEYKLNSISEDLSKALRVKSDLKSEIEQLDRILFTSQFIDLINNEECPFCLEKIDLEENKCICGSEHNLDFSRFIYSDKEYIKLLKTKIKSSETINEVIIGYKKEYAQLEEIIREIKEQIKKSVNEVKSITNDIESNSNISTLEEITDKIIPLKETASELEILNERIKDVKLSKTLINKLEHNIFETKEMLKKLEEEKDNKFQRNIEQFEKIYSEYLTDFFNGSEDEYFVKLDRNYYPFIGKYREQSFNVPRRLFFYLSLLKLSLDSDYQITFPKFLIIDTLKAEGIEISHLKKIFTYIEEFNDLDCQIIITSGYDEFDEQVQGDYLIDYLSPENKLLKKV